ncbi:MAG: hypothetical protein VYC34_08300 [Planctomycetota bacterium]|nr:hypothetical protein [Planctomycetota bacterium]
MNATLRTTGLASLALLAAAPASAQVQWDRHITNIAIVPDGEGAHTVSAAYFIEVAGVSSAPLVLDTEIALEVNGIRRNASIVQYDLNALGGCVDGGNCGGSCGNYSQDGFADLLLCVREGTGPGGQSDCACRTPTITANFPGVDLEPGDAVRFILAPGPGGLPEQDTTNDFIRETFDGDPIFWERRLKNVRLEEDAAGAHHDRFDVDTIGDTNERPASLAYIVIILLNGVEVNSDVACNGLFIANPGGCDSCGNLCHVADCDGDPITLHCEIQQYFDPTCYCTATSVWGFELPEPLTPDDEVLVVLRPAPGALPELPGFEEDEEAVRLDPCPADLDGDGVVGAADLAALLGSWAEFGVPADFNGDGVGADDLALLLGSWGPCFPV